MTYKTTNNELVITDEDGDTVSFIRQDLIDVKWTVVRIVKSAHNEVLIDRDDFKAMLEFFGHGDLCG